MELKKKNLRLSQAEDDGNSKLHQSYLAQVIQTSPEDDSLAIEHSILHDDHHRRLVEKSWGKYILAWPLMMFLAVWVMLKDVFYWLLVRPEDKERKLLGPKRGTLWFDLAHPLGHIVRNGVTTSAALDVIYSIDVAIPQPRTLGEKLIRFWLDQPDGQAVRNRLRLTYQLIGSELERLYASGQKEIRFLVLACGSAQASIEATADFLNDHSDAKVRFELVDLSESSLCRAVRLAEARGIDHITQIVVQNLKNFIREQPNAVWDIVEMVGFLDYRPRKSAVWFCRHIRRLLKPRGLFVGAHICPDPWSFVVRWVINWPLLRRRKPQDYRRLLLEAGYSQSEIEHFGCEPNKIYVLSSCRKQAL